MKKIVSVCIIICLLAAAPAAMAKQKTAHDKRSEFLQQLGIVSQLKAGEAIVSRGEFTAMAVRLLGDTVEVKDSGFSDVPADYKYKKEIDCAAARGLIGGVGAGKFSPDAPITFNAAIKILITVLGYEKTAVTSGDYPTGYLTVASQLRVSRGVNDSEGGLFFDEAVRLIYNALYTEVLYQTGISEKGISYSNSNGKTLIEEAFNLKEIEGTVESIGFCALSNGGVKNKMSVNGKMLTLDRLSPDVLVGSRVRAWYDEETLSLCALDVDVINSEIEISAKDIWQYENFRLETQNGDYRFDKGFIFVKNGRAKAPSDSDFIFEAGSLTLLDNNGDGAYDVVFAKNGKYVSVQTVNRRTMSVYDKNTVMDFYDDKERDISYNDGASFDSISEGSILTVYESEDGLCTQISVSNKTVSGKITELSDDKVWIDSAEYETNSRFEGTAISQEGVFLLASDGTVTDFVSGDGILKYGYFLDYSSGKGLEAQGKIKVLTSSNKKEVFTLAKKVMLDAVQADAADCAVKLLNGDYPAYQVIKYALNEQGEISAIDTATDVSQITDVNEKYKSRINDNNSLTKYVSQQNVYYYSTPDAGAPHFVFGGTVLFSIPTDMSAAKRFDDDMFSCITTARLTSSSSYKVDAYDYSEDFVPGAVCVYMSKATADGKNLAIASNSADSYIVTDVREAYENGGETKKLYVYGADTYKGLTISPDYCDILKNAGRIPNKGDIVRLVQGDDGLVIGISRDVLYKNGALTVNYGTDGVNNAGNGSLTFYTGNAFSCSDRVLSIAAQSYPPTVSSYPAPLDGIAAFNISKLTAIVIYESETATVRRAQSSDIVPMLSAKDDASYMAVRTGYSEPRLIVIYQ